MRIAIAGPGRSGTSLLVQLLGGWGFSVPQQDRNWNEDAQAGLESRIAAESPYEVDKDPWAYEYLDRVDEAVLAGYDALIVPIRDRSDAATSRSVQERLHRAKHSDSDHWLWDSWGTVAGGAVARTDTEAISVTLAVGLWDLLEKATRAGMHPIVLHFPRFANDFDYLWGQLGIIIQTRQSRDAALAVWTRLVDPGKVRIAAGESATTDPQVRELQVLVEMLRKEYRALAGPLGEAIAQRDEAIAQRDEAIAQRDEAIAQRDEVENSRIWRSTGWYRKFRTQ